MSLTKGFRVFHKTEEEYSILLEWKSISDDGLLLKNGTIVTVDGKIKDGMRSKYNKVLDGYGCIGSIKFSNSSGFDDTFLVIITSFMSVGKLLNSEVLRVTGVSFISLSNGAIDSDNRCSDLKRLLSSGKFYFAWNAGSISDATDTVVDLTSSFQKLHVKERNIDKRFFWNQLMQLDFKHFGIPCDRWLFRLMCGGIDIKTIYIASQQAKAVVISRLSCERAGTRYNVRGINDNGNVANFVESEQIIVVGNKLSSFMQVRGSVPLFWEQPGLNVGSHKVRMSRGFEASSPAFERHLAYVLQHYKKFAIVNLLGHKEGENNLSRAFLSHHSLSPQCKEIPMIYFDYHSEVRGKAENISKLKNLLTDVIKEFGFFASEDGNVQQQQNGVLRVNCLDCLDRTNSVQTYIGMKMIKQQLESLGIVNNKQLEDRFQEAFKTIWPQTGDLISRMYAGTGALEGKVKLKDGARSMTRAIQNNFLDQNKQNAIDILTKGVSINPELYSRAKTLFTNQYLHLSAKMMNAMCNMHNDYTYPNEMNIFIGTWNVNGGKHFRSIAYKHEKLEDWLLDGPKNKSVDKNGEEYVAMYDYQSEEQGDLCFAVGDIIPVVEELEDGQWLRGSLNGKEGIFPAAYVSKFLPKYVALFDFPCQQEGDLEFAKGDYIEVSKSTGEWWEGKVVRENDEESKLGMFPANFVKKVSMNNNTSEDEENEEHILSEPIDIFAVGFEEMVELSAGNIVNTSLSNQQAWGVELQKTISRDLKYVQIASEQLVGVCLYIFTRPHHAPHVKNVEISSVKTGMGGATGNKGGIGVSLKFYNSSLVFVCSHLAAGQKEIQDRNNDFAEICKRMTFSNSRNIFNHDHVFWCGDLNYRIDMSNDDVKSCVANEDWNSLHEFDQLNLQRKAGNTFTNFEEGIIDFAPTYKYDLFSDDYDTSEKFRTPAWTDRVLWHSNKQNVPAKLLHYGRAELKTSDHRPVNAIFRVNILQTDEDHLYVAFNKAMYENGPLDASVVVYYDGDLKAEGICDSIIEQFKIGGEIKAFFPFEDHILVTFSNGTEAIKALDCNDLLVDGNRITVELKSPDWANEIANEMQEHNTSALTLNDENYMLEINDKQNVLEFEYEQGDSEYYASDLDSRNISQTTNANEIEAMLDYNVVQSSNYDDETYQENEMPAEDLPTDNYYNDEDFKQSEEFETYEHSDQGWACEEMYKQVMVAPAPSAAPIKPPQPSANKRQKPPAPPRPITSPASTPTESRPAIKKPPPRPSSMPSVKVGPPQMPPPMLPSPLLPSPIAPVSVGLPKPPVIPRKPKRKAPPAPPPSAITLSSNKSFPTMSPRNAPPALPRTPPKASTTALPRAKPSVNMAFDEGLFLLDVPITKNSNVEIVNPTVNFSGIVMDQPLVPIPVSRAPFPQQFTSAASSKPKQPPPSSLMFDSILTPEVTPRNQNIKSLFSNDAFAPSNLYNISNTFANNDPFALNAPPLSSAKTSTSNQNDPWSIPGQQMKSNTVPNSFSSDFSKLGFN